MPIQEEDWGQDINLEGQFFQKNGILNLEPDKDLMLACERYMDNSPYQTYYDDDDTNSSVYTTRSFMSSRYTAPTDLELPNIDEYLLNISPSPKLPGTIKRLGAHYKEQSDDWNDDIEIPVTGITPKRLKDVSSMLDEFDDDDVGPSISQRGSVHATFLCYEREEDDDDDMKGLDFPENLGTLNQKLVEKKKVGYDSKVTSKIPVPIKSSPILSSIQRESDDDDFLDGLDITNHKLFKQQQQQQQVKKPMVSRLARPVVKQEQQQPKPTLKPRRNFLSSTQSSLNREAETRKKWVKPKPVQVEKRSASGYTLISRPKTKIETNYCARLDSIDNLNDLVPKKRINVTFKTKSSVDPERPWRQNMQSKAKGKMTLIQPNQQNLKKEYNDMKYDEKTHQWKGNESSLSVFQEKAQRKSRLMLMSPKQHKPSKYAAMMGNNMVFNPDLQKWVSCNGTECNELDAIEDLQDAPKKQKKEYHLSREIKRQMTMEQQDHDDYMRNWPLDVTEPQLTTESGVKVGASKYFIKIRLF